MRLLTQLPTGKTLKTERVGREFHISVVGQQGGLKLRPSELAVLREQLRPLDLAFEEAHMPR